MNILNKCRITERETHTYIQRDKETDRQGETEEERKEEKE